MVSIVLPESHCDEVSVDGQHPHDADPLGERSNRGVDESQVHLLELLVQHGGPPAILINPLGANGAAPCFGRHTL